MTGTWDWTGAVSVSDAIVMATRRGGSAVPRSRALSVFGLQLLDHDEPGFWAVRIWATLRSSKAIEGD